MNTTEAVAGKEPKRTTQGTAYNKDFGKGRNNVARGDHNHKVGELSDVIGKSDAIDQDLDKQLATSAAVYRVNEKVDVVGGKVDDLKSNTPVIYRGSGDPDNTIGKDGDLYVFTSQTNTTVAVGADLKARRAYHVFIKSGRVGNLNGSWKTIIRTL